MVFFKSLPRFRNFFQTKFVRNLGKPRLSTNDSSFIYVVSSGYKWNPKSVIIKMANEKFIFNCGPGICRFLSEHRKVSRNLSALFVTRPVWENIGGVGPLLLKLRELQNPNITVHGFDHVLDLCEAGRSILRLGQCTINIGNGQYDSGKSKVTSIKLYPTMSDIKQKLGESQFKRNFKNMHLDNEEVTAYILTLRHYRQKINYEKLVEEGVSAAMAVQLQTGNAITMPNGEVVTIENFVHNAGNTVVLVMDCPSEAYIPSIKESEILQQYHKADAENNITIVHFTPTAVMRQPGYVEWMRSFPSSTFHLVVNDSNLVDSLLTLRYRQELLSKLHPGFFPPLKDSGYYWLPAEKYAQDNSHLVYGQSKQFSAGQSPFTVPEKADTIQTAEKGSPEWLSQWADVADLNIYEGRPGTTVLVDKPVQVSRNNEQHMDGFTYTTVFQSTLSDNNVQDVHKKFENAGVDLTNPAKVQADFEKMYPRVILLGTGAKEESKERNVSGILLRIKFPSGSQFLLEMLILGEPLV